MARVVERVSSNSSRRQFVCPDCGKTNFPSASAVAMHRNAKHAANGSSKAAPHVSALHLKQKPKKRSLLARLFAKLFRRS